jgi:transcriptional antiterminator RfaH
MSSFKDGWYVIYTKPRHEKKVAGKLTETGIDNFLPTIKRVRKWNDRNKCIDEPLFPSYVFVHLDNMQGYYTGMDTEGVLNYVRVGKQVARVSDTVVNNIKLVTNQEKDVEVSDKYFRPGQQLVISQGALTGLSCEIIQFNGNKKVLVRIDLLQRNILLTVPTEHLVAV